MFAAVAINPFYLQGKQARPALNSLYTSRKASMIAFNSSSGGIGVVNVTNEKVKRLISHGFNPHWAPDGSWIVFDSEKDGNTDIFIMDTKGGNVKRLTTDPAHDTDPCWSPDGKKIAFVSDRDQNNEIYVMNVDGTNQVNITNNPSDDRDPAWCCQSSTMKSLLKYSPFFLVVCLIIVVVLILKKR